VGGNAARQGAGDRTTLAVKLPLAETSVDFMASAANEHLGELRPVFERILSSLRPLAAP